MKAARHGIGGSRGLGICGLAPIALEPKGLLRIGQLIGDDQRGEQ